MPGTHVERTKMIKKKNKIKAVYKGKLTSNTSKSGKFSKPQTQGKAALPPVG